MTRNLIIILAILALILPVNAAFLNISPQEPVDMGWNETYPLLSGIRALTGRWNFGGFNVSNIGEPVALMDASNRQWTLSQINSSPIIPPDMSWNVTYPLLSGVRQFTGKIDLAENNVSNITSSTGGDAVNKTYVDTKMFSRDGLTIESDFYDPSTQAIPGFLGAAISSGTVGAVAATAGHPGVIYLRDSTTANGGYRFGCAGTQLIAGGEFYEVVFQSVGTRITQHARMGWSDSVAGSTMVTDGVFFNITNRSGVTGGRFNISGVAAANNARTVTASQYPLTASTWYRGTIQINPSANLATYTLYNEAGSQLWTDTVNSNIPTAAGRDTSPCIIAAETTTDAAANILVVDYAKWAINRSLTR